MMRHSRRLDDDGFTLAELIVYSLLLIMIMGIAATLFIRVITVQRDTIDAAHANNIAQVTFKEVEADLRNAAFTEVADDGQLMVTQSRIATNADAASSTWVCVGYYMSDSDGELRRYIGADGAPTRAALTAAASGSAAGATSTWPVVRDGFSEGSSSRAFGVADGLIDTSTDGVLGVSKLLRINLAVDTENGHKPVEFSKSITVRPQGNTVPACN
ncbi:type II secretion system protein [Demequina activiva]|uniref:Prepilin-type N-terminal cleavage/methylation domain-containing protein n=1 Tax=Demequina activiva TaxID=1582364 RepID=A0A919UGN4_9MICO|nr:type II secretion system protein [Demequina activiva]GIG54624.1 hypothetical protein Dac01nite_13760 [Demequina activiva]